VSDITSASGWEAKARRGEYPRVVRPLSIVAPLLVALALLPALAQPASAQSGWSQLTQRIVASRPNGPFKVLAGAEPPGFVFPLHERPALLVLGSTWFTVVPAGEPLGVRIFYAPTPRTTAVVDALIAKLKAANYAETPQTRFPNAFVGDSGPSHLWCPADVKRPALTLNVENVGGVPALDIGVQPNAGSSFCGFGSHIGPSTDAPIPALGGISGLEIFARMRMTESSENSLGSLAVIRTLLPAREAVAKLAERFTAKGWIARAPVVDGTTVLQHFSRVEGSRQWNALLLLEPRTGSTTLFDAALDVTQDPLDSVTR
jgi:hypothetical protein